MLRSGELGPSIFPGIGQSCLVQGATVPLSAIHCYHEGSSVLSVYGVRSNAADPQLLYSQLGRHTCLLTLETWSGCLHCSATLRIGPSQAFLRPFTTPCARVLIRSAGRTQHSGRQDDVSVTKAPQQLQSALRAPVALHCADPPLKRNNAAVIPLNLWQQPCLQAPASACSTCWIGAPNTCCPSGQGDSKFLQQTTVRKLHLRRSPLIVTLTACCSLILALCAGSVL